MPHMKIQHIALSVSDIGKSGPWYEQLFGFEKVAEFADPPLQIYMTPEGQALDLRQDPKVKDGRFDVTNLGLDHLAFLCADAQELAYWQGRIEEMGIENSGVQESPFGKHLNLRDPDGIALEF